MSDPNTEELETEPTPEAPPSSDAPETAIQEGEIFNEIAPEAQPDTEAVPSQGGRGIDALMGISMKVQVVLGGCRLPIADLLKLGRGSVIELDRRIGEPVDILVNGRLVAKGDLQKLADDNVGVTLNEMIKNPDGSAE